LKIDKWGQKKDLARLLTKRRTAVYTPISPITQLEGCAAEKFAAEELQERNISRYSSDVNCELSVPQLHITNEINYR